MHWLWRATIAVTIGAVYGGISGALFTYSLKTCRWADDYIFASLPIDLKTVLSLTVGAYIWPCLITIVIYGLLTYYIGPKKPFDPETRCRKFGYILRGIREPICSECGEKI